MKQIKRHQHPARPLGEIKLFFTLTAKLAIGAGVRRLRTWSRVEGQAAAGAQGQRPQGFAVAKRPSLRGNFCWLYAKAGIRLLNICLYNLDKSMQALAAAYEHQPVPMPGDPRRREARGDWGSEIWLTAPVAAQTRISGRL